MNHQTVYFHPDYNATGLEKETTRKASAIAASLLERPVPGVTVVAPTPASEVELRAVHTDAYLDAVRTGEPPRLAESNGIGWDPALFASVCASTGGVRDAVLTALASGGPSGSLSSGLHHASRSGGNGFCTFNGLVVGARAALAAGAGRVVILDLDAHCGGGTAGLIHELPAIEQVDVSVSRFDSYASRPGARLVLAGGEDYLDVVEREIDRITSPDTIDVLLYNAGMDPHRGSGGPDAIDTEVLAHRERLVFDWALAHGIPVAWVLAGGYTWGGLDMAGLVDLHRLTIEAASATSGRGTAQ